MLGISICWVLCETPHVQTNHDDQKVEQGGDQKSRFYEFSSLHALLTISCFLLQTATQLLSSPKCTAQKKKEYTKSVMWSAKQIGIKYESKLDASNATATSQVPVGLLDGLLGQLQIQAPTSS